MNSSYLSPLTPQLPGLHPLVFHQWHANLHEQTVHMANPRRYDPSGLCVVSPTH